MTTPLKTGKLPPVLLKRLLKTYAAPGPGVITGPGIGLDAAVLDPEIEGRYLLAKTDPITFTASDIGFYAAIINANDIACMGGEPKWFTAAIILPAGATEELAESIFRSLSENCHAVGAVLVGGHTEVTHGLDRTIVVGHMLGLVPKDRLITAAGAKPGDALILTKGIAIEAVSIIAREKASELSWEYSPEFIDRCAGFIRNPGLSVVKDARVALDAGDIHAFHDPTEGGLATGLHEMAEASGCGMEVLEAGITILPEAAELLGRYGLDPLGSIASGALLMAVAGTDFGRVMDALARNGIPASMIGRVREREFGMKLLRGGVLEDLPRFERDEITKLF